MSNKITFGLEQVHIAFIGTSQTKSIEVTGAPSTDGEITITVTSALLEPSPVAVVVPLASETHDTVTKVASTIVNALSNNSTISAVFNVRHQSGVIYLATKVAQANDATLNISFADSTTGTTMGTATDVAAGTASYGAPQAIPGAVKFNRTPQGDENNFYADNTIYDTYTNNNGYTAEVEMALIPDAVLVEMMGWETDANGMVIETADAVGKEFAFMGQIQGDKKNRRFVYYRCKASRPGKEHSTKTESMTPATDALSLKIIPIEVNGKKLVKGTLELSDTNATAYNAFFSSVTLPQ